MSGKQELSQKQKSVLASLLGGLSVAQASKNAGVTDRTVYRWLSDPSFQAELRRREQEVVERTTRRLLALAETALDGLQLVLEEPGSRGAGVRLRAVQVSLEQFLKFRDVFDIEERLSRLERQVLK